MHSSDKSEIIKTRESLYQIIEGVNLLIIVLLIFFYGFIFSTPDLFSTQGVRDFLLNLIPSAITVIGIPTLSLFLISRRIKSIRESEQKEFLRDAVIKALDEGHDLEGLFNSGLSKVCGDIYESSVLDKIKSAKKRIWILASILEDTTILPRHLLAAAYKNGCKDIKILMLQPRSPGSNERADELNRGEDDFESRFNSRKRDISDINEREKIAIQLYTYEMKAPLYLCICDNWALVGVFWKDGYATEHAMLEIHGVSNEENSTLLGKLINEEFSNQLKKSLQVNLVEEKPLNQIPS